MRFLLILILSIIYSNVGAFDASFYAQTQNIFPNKYDIYWKTTDTDIFLALVLKDHSSWVGFGFGEQTSGGMPGSDVVLLEWDNTTLKVSDRYTLGTYEPIIDTCDSNWILTSYETTNDVLYIELKRVLDTQDSQDRPVIQGGMRVIAAFGTTPTVQYHEANRLATVVTFIPSGVVAPPLEGNITTVSLRMNMVIPNVVTTYACHAFTVPHDTNTHIVEFRPYIQPGNEQLVHHFLLTICEYENVTGNLVHDYAGLNSQLCYQSPLGNIAGGCRSLAYGWAVGAGDYPLPAEAGFAVGPDPDSIHYVILETHYNNPTMMVGVNDRSGVDLILTDQLRQHEVGVFWMGDVFTSGKPIPAQTADYGVEGECLAKCTSYWDHEINVFASFLHMHSVGSAIYTVLTRHDNTSSEQMITNRIEFWDFGLQQYTPVNFVIRPGDSLNTVCQYNTLGSSTPVRFGPASSDEMCMDFLWYYPRLLSPSGNDFTFCGMIGEELQAYPNGSIDYVSDQQSSVCGTILDLPTILDDTGKTLLNPQYPLPNRADLDKRKFGITPVCNAPPPPTGEPSSSSSLTYTFAFMLIHMIIVFFHT
jgi:hypothetical protein